MNIKPPDIPKDRKEVERLKEPWNKDSQTSSLSPSSDLLKRSGLLYS